MRPSTLKEYIGQSHLLAADKPLPRAIKNGQLHSMILWGPPETGKMILAELIARYGQADVERLSAVTSGIKEIRGAIAIPGGASSCLSMRCIILIKASRTPFAAY